MKGDISRDSYRSVKRYKGVRLQQGRVQLDSDWNEAQDLNRESVESLGEETIGKSGAPKSNPGFRISQLNEMGKSTDLAISKGTYFVDGIKVANECENASYYHQPHFLRPDPLETGTKWTGYIYLDVWTRTIDAIEDPDIREPALGGTDTATRTENVWQVRLKPKLESIVPPKLALPIQPGPVRLALKVTNDDDMALDETFYDGTENQLIRVEVHRCTGDRITLKWAYDNASRAATILDVKDDERMENPNGKVITVGGMQPLGIETLGKYSHVEIINSGIEGRGDGSDLVAINKVLDRSKIALVPTAINIMSTRMEGTLQKVALPKIVYWNGTFDVWFPPAKDMSDPIQLKQGQLSEKISLTFHNGEVESGDYWTIPVRASAGKILWPNENGRTRFVEREGPDHHTALLAIVDVNEDGSIELTEDLWKSFPSLSEIDAKDVSYTSKASDYLGECSDVESALIKLSEITLTKSCSVTVGKDGIYKTLEDALARFEKNVSMRICLLPGVHALKGHLILNKQDADLEIIGAGCSSCLDLGSYQMRIENAKCVRIKDVSIESRLNFKSNDISSALTFKNCDNIEVVSCQMACESRNGHSLMTVDNPTLLRIRGNAIRIDNPALPIRALIETFEKLAQILDVELMKKDQEPDTTTSKFQTVRRFSTDEIGITQEIWSKEENARVQILAGKMQDSIVSASKYIDTKSLAALNEMTARIKSTGLALDNTFLNENKSRLENCRQWALTQAPGSAIRIVFRDGYKMEIEDNVIVGKVEIEWQSLGKSIPSRSVPLGGASKKETKPSSGRAKEVVRITIDDIMKRPDIQDIDIPDNPSIRTEVITQTISIRSNKFGAVRMYVPVGDRSDEDSVRIVHFSDNIQSSGWTKLIGDRISIHHNNFTSPLATYVDIDTEYAIVENNIGSMGTRDTDGMEAIVADRYYRSMGMVSLRGTAKRCLVSSNIGFIDLVDRKK